MNETSFSDTSIFVNVGQPFPNTHFDEEDSAESSVEASPHQAARQALYHQAPEPSFNYQEFQPFGHMKRALSRSVDTGLMGNYA
jgi:hypothetical protein